MPRKLQRESLTIERIRKFTCTEKNKQVFLRDDDPLQLAVRATSGAKSYIFESKLNGETVRSTIGDVKTWALDDARIEARRLQTLIDQGIDPREVKKQIAIERIAKNDALEAQQRELARRRRYTLRALCEAYTESLKKAGKLKSASATSSAFKCHVFDAHPNIADTVASEVTKKQVVMMIRKVRETGKERTAGVLRSYLFSAFNAAIKAEDDTAKSSDLIAFEIEHNPVSSIKTIPVKKGHRALSDEELRAYMTALDDALPDQALWLALLAGGQRMAQLLRAKTTDFNPDTQTLRLWDGKGKRTTAREHLIPLAPRAAALVANLIDRAKQLESERDPSGNSLSLWIFSTHGQVKMTETTPGKRLAHIAQSMKVEAFNLRDIRRTVETSLAAMGISKDIRAQLLSHGLGGVQNTNYDKHEYFNEKRAVLAAWEHKLEQIEAGIKSPRNVVALRSA